MVNRDARALLVRGKRIHRDVGTLSTVRVDRAAIVAATLLLHLQPETTR